MDELSGTTSGRTDVRICVTFVVLALRPKKVRPPNENRPRCAIRHRNPTSFAHRSFLAHQSSHPAEKAATPNDDELRIARATRFPQNGHKILKIRIKHLIVNKS